MNNETLKQIISQIKKYGLVNVFKTIGNFENWMSSINSKQIDNFLSLNIEPKEVENFRNILIDRNLLSCQDYSKKVEAISKLKNGDGCWHLFHRICNPKFLESRNFYKDIEMISKAETARYCLNALEENLFIDSPYHTEDLKLIVEAKDSYTAEALVGVAQNIFSINSPYHQEDMLLISKADNEHISSKCSEIGLEYLATNEESLNDKYHLENMHILAEHTNANKELFEIMTCKRIIQGKDYRKEVEILKNAKSRMNARALYYYIVNPREKFFHDAEYISSLPNELYDLLGKSPRIFDHNLMAGSNDLEYLNNLIKISNMDEKFVMYYTALLMNPHFIKSQYKGFDLKVLESITDFDIFMDLYKLIYKGLDMVDNLHHKSDVMLLIKTLDSKIRKWFIKRMKNENNNNYDYDIEYITKLKLDSISDEIKEEMKYYLFEEKGINDPKHREKLESLLNGIMVERQESLLEYLNKLEEELDTKKDISQLGEPLPVPLVEEPVSNKKAKSRVLSLFKKDKR